MNILITGANGYLAKNFIKKLVGETNHRLILLVRKGSDINELIELVNNSNIILYDGSRKSLQNLNNYKVDLVFHLANYYPDSKRPAIPEKIINSNLTLIIDIVETLRVKGNNIPRIINVSSSVVNNNDDNSLYKITKKCAESYLKSQMNCQTYFLHNIYGKDDTRPKLINHLINSSKSGEKLKMMCHCDTKINLVYVKDVIEAFMLGLEKKPNSENDIYTDSLTLKEVVDTFNKVSENQVYVEWPRDEKIKNSNCIGSKTPTGWKPKYNLTSGLSEILK